MLDAADEAFPVLPELASRQQPGGASLCVIGALERAVAGWLDLSAKTCVHPHTVLGLTDATTRRVPF
jgi:hypothetical protein